MKSFYVECQLPQTIQAEIFAEFDTFDAALVWISVRMRENPRRLPKLVSRVPITPKMARTLDAKGVVAERSRGSRRKPSRPA